MLIRAGRNRAAPHRSAIAPHPGISRCGRASIPPGCSSRPPAPGNAPPGPTSAVPGRVSRSSGRCSRLSVTEYASPGPMSEGLVRAYGAIGEFNEHVRRDPEIVAHRQKTVMSSPARVRERPAAVSGNHGRVPDLFACVMAFTGAAKEVRGARKGARQRWKPPLLACNRPRHGHSIPCVLFIRCIAQTHQPHLRFAAVRFPVPYRWNRITRLTVCEMQVL